MMQKEVLLLLFMGQSNMAGRGAEAEAPAVIQRVQEELAQECEDILLVSRQLKTFADRGLMKDEFHYLQRGYNLVGEDAGNNILRILEL